MLLLGDALKITFAPKLPSLSAYKIRLLCFSALQSQFLPQEVLAPKASEILRSLMKCIEKSSDPNFKIECLKVSIKFRVHLSEFSREFYIRSLQSFSTSTQSVSFRRSRNSSPQFCDTSSTIRQKFGIPPPGFFAPWLEARLVEASQPLSADPSQGRSWDSSTQTRRGPPRLRTSPPRNLVR